MSVNTMVEVWVNMVVISGLTIVVSTVKTAA